MRRYPYRLVNVFAESIFGGNPLCVFEAAASLTDTEMQALALQFNLSETTYVLPSARATARVRIFTPTFELPFAGHPTLGSAHVVRALIAAGNAITLEMAAGIIPVSAEGDRWTLRAAAAKTRPLALRNVELARTLAIDTDDILEGAAWVNTGTEQLIIPLATAAAVARAAPVAELLARLASETGRAMAYVFAPSGPGKLVARFFFLKHTSVIEDPGTGSATANLGAWLANHGQSPCTYGIEQGAVVGRLCHLGLAVDAANTVFVSGRVMEIGRGEVSLPE